MTTKHFSRRNPKKISGRDPHTQTTYLVSQSNPKPYISIPTPRCKYDDYDDAKLSFFYIFCCFNFPVSNLANMSKVPNIGNVYQLKHNYEMS